MSIGHFYIFIVAKHVLLTGKPGSGKTTLLKRIVSRLRQRGLKVGGFYTEEVRIRASRVGFRVKTLNGKEGWLAHVSIQGPRVSKYGVDLKGFEEVGVKSLEEAIKACDVVVIDEIGKMELLSERFREVVRRAFEERRVVGTIALKNNSFTRAIKGRSDTSVYEVTPVNREELLREVLEELDANR